MNNFVFSQDPILFNPTIPQNTPQNEVDIKRQLDSIMLQYQALQQRQSQTPPLHTQIEKTEDYLGDLDTLLKSLPSDIIEILNENSEFIQLNANIQQNIQAELIKEIKWKINSDQSSIKTITRLKEIINETKQERESEDKKSMSELTDYIKNYSDMTFNEYKRLKNNNG